MRKFLKVCKSLSYIFITIFFLSCSVGKENSNELRISSPDGKNVLEFMISKEGIPYYSVSRKGQKLLNWSQLGFILKDGNDFYSGFKYESSAVSEFEEVWEPVHGQFEKIKNHYNELKVSLVQQDSNQRECIIYFRLFDDGLAFRYVIPKQQHQLNIEIVSEETEFNFTENCDSWWIPGDYTKYEFLYNHTKISKVDSANTPITFKMMNGSYLSVHEADMTDYSDMTLKRTGPTTLKCSLVPWPDGIKVRGQTPLTTPWRTIQIADNPGALIESSLILNLNEKCQIKDTDWIKPFKYMGIWWSIHLGFETFEMGPYHAATTAAAKKMIDYANEFEIDGLLIEGWNKGWELRETRTDIPDFFASTDDYNLKEVAAYAQSKDVKLIMFHETFGNIPHYEKNMTKAFEMCKQLGIEYIKVGCAGTLDPPDQFRHGQSMVRYYRNLIETAAKYNLMLIIHEPIKQTGWRRTYPNWLSAEGVRGMEFNAWSNGNPPNHTTIVPFTRMLAGPIDYNTGIFDIKFDSLKDKKFNWRKKRKNYPKEDPPCVKTTLAKQLAQFVVIYSPVQMLPDLPENYKQNPAFQFIKDVPVDWSDTKVLNGEIGEFITIARKEKGSRNWFLGSLTNEKVREFSISLDFLEDDINYKAIIYKDGIDAHWDQNPTSVEIDEMKISSEDILNLKLASGGGAAISIIELGK